MIGAFSLVPPLFLLQDRVQYFKDDDPMSGIFILIGIGVLAVTILAVNLIKNGTSGFKKKGTKRTVSPRRFSKFTLNRMARSRGLNRDQSKFLEFIFRTEGVTNLEGIMNNTPALDRHFKRAYKQIESDTTSEGTVQQRLFLLFSTRNGLEASQEGSANPRITENTTMVLTHGKNTYPVRIYSSRGAAIMAEHPVAKEGSLARIPVGARVSLSNKNFSFDCQVEGNSEHSKKAALQLSQIGRVKHLVQRRFKRRQTVIPCSFALIRMEETGSRRRKKAQKMIVEHRRLTGNIQDISIGGSAIRTSSSVPAGSRLKIELSQDGHTYAVLGQVLRLNQSSAANTVMHIKFIKVPLNAMNMINAMVFEYNTD